VTRTAADSQKLPLANVSEASFQAEIVKVAKLHGWLVHAERPGQNRRGKWSTAIQGDAGFPDLVLVHPVRHMVLIWEGKSSKGQPSADQTAWLEAFKECGLFARVVRPSDWNEILEVLRG